MPLSRLPLTVPLAWRETAPSYASRLAARNGLDAADFCVDFGTSFRAVIDGNPAALTIMAGLGGVALEELSAWSAIHLGGGTHEFRGHRFRGKTIRRPELVGCPECLREDAAASDLPPHQAMAMRGHWLVPHVTKCVKHKRRLAPLFRENSLFPRYDTSRQLERIAPEILSGARGGAVRRPFAFDEWFDARLEDGPGDDWLSGHSLHAAATFCRLLGTARLRLENLAPYRIPEEDRDILREMGFQIARHGEAAVREALVEIQRYAAGPQEGPRKIFPALYERLAHDYAEDPDYAVFRRILRDHMLTLWPLGVGDDLLGEPVMERRLHSVRTAAHATGVDPRRLRKVLAAEGLVPEGEDSLPDAWEVFDAHAAQPVLDRMTRLVPATVYAGLIGATRSQFNLLVADGVLTPAVDTPGVYAVWDPRDGEAFLSRLLAGAVQLRQAQHGWTHISKSAQRLKIGPGDIIEAIFAGRIRRIGNLEGRGGYAAVYVDHSEVAAVLGPDAPLAQTIDAFAKSVGVGQPVWLRRLIVNGHTPSTIMRNPRTKAEQRYVTSADAEAFHARFLTLRTISQAYGRSWQSLHAELKQHGIALFSPDGRDYGRIYLREWVEEALGPGHQQDG